MFNRMGLESLVQRGRSDLYAELVSLYQETIEALEGIPKPSHGDVLMALKAVKFKEALTKIIQDQMGITVSKILILDSTLPNLFCGLAENKQFNKNLKTKTATPGMMLEEINRFYDDKKAVLDAPKDLPMSLSVYLGFFTSLWRTKNDEGTSYFTKEELAAITLHELGHADHFIRASLRVYGRQVVANDFITYVNQTHDRDVILVLIAALKKSRYLNSSWTKILAVTEKHFTSSNALDDPYYWEALATLASVVAAESSSWQLVQFDSLLGSRRDQVGTRLHDVDAERSADDFSARNGAYQALVSGLKKIEDLSENRFDVILRQFMWNSPAVVLGLLVHFLSVFHVGAEDIAGGYDPMLRRLELIVETAKHAFHDPTLSDDAKADIKEQIAQAEACIATMRAAPHRQIRQQLKQWKDNVVRFGRIIASPIHNRLTGDYERLQDANRSLGRHPLYYLANK